MELLEHEDLVKNLTEYEENNDLDIIEDEDLLISTIDLNNEQPIPIDLNNEQTDPTPRPKVGLTSFLEDSYLYNPNNYIASSLAEAGKAYIGYTISGESNHYRMNLLGLGVVDVLVPQIHPEEAIPFATWGTVVEVMIDGKVIYLWQPAVWLTGH
jgi:hypothetical protein